MAVTNELFLIAISVFIYLAMAITWDFSLFKAKQSNDENNIVKVLIIWLLMWLQPLMIQLSLLYASDYSRSANIITLLETYYEVSMWVAWVISIYFMIFFGYNVMLWLSGVTKKGRN